MKKRILALLIAMLMLTGMTACGGEEEAAGNDAAVTSGDVDVSNWSCYMGVMDDESTLYYAFNEDGSRGALYVLSPDATESVSVIGDCGFDEEGGVEYIVDDETGLTIAYGVVDEGDGGYSLDFGELGTAIVVVSDPEEVLNAMDVIEADTIDITADFIASLG
ncbi:MAG: hypothetical protein IJX14_03095 [Clostridia bacterium]|nr:hypothetical protein [Clostridia bacterium]